MYEEPKFMHRYGYYEARCRLPKNHGWHAAFWLQAPGVGSHPDPRFAGVECDIMENYLQHSEGKIIGGNLWNGYGKCAKGSRHFRWDYVETPDTWHYYGVDWSPDGYTFYADGKFIGKVVPPELATEEMLKDGTVRVGPVSQVEQFILLSTECHGYRGPGLSCTDWNHKPGTPVSHLFNAVLQDCFEIDHVRVFDQV